MGLSQVPLESLAAVEHVVPFVGDSIGESRDAASNYCCESRDTASSVSIPFQSMHKSRASAASRLFFAKGFSYSFYCYVGQSCESLRALFSEAAGHILPGNLKVILFLAYSCFVDGVFAFPKNHISG